MTAAALLRQLAQPALDAFENSVTVTVPTRLLTALADQLDAVAALLDTAERERLLWPDSTGLRLVGTLAEVERAAKEHTSQ